MNGGTVHYNSLEADFFLFFYKILQKPSREKKEKRYLRTVKCCLKMKQIGNKYVVVPQLIDAHAHALNQLLQKQKIIPRKELQFRT
jgi:hypothetical protein